MKRIVCSLALLGCSATLWAQDPERVTVPLSDPSRPASVRIDLMNGKVSVRAYAGKELIVEVRGGSGRRRGGDAPPGMHRIDGGGSGIAIEQENNRVHIGGGPFRNVEAIDVQVPRNTNLDIKAQTGPVEVEGVSGELEIQALNGRVDLRNVSGAVVAHSLNGGINATVDQVTPNRPMSFSTLNGGIDVTLPAAIKANVKMKSENGEIFTDFDILTKPTAAPTPERENGRFKIKFDRAFYGSINGGGPEFQFTTLNGRIFIRKK